MNIRLPIVTAFAALAINGAAFAASLPQTFDVAASGVFIDAFKSSPGAKPDENLTVSGFFTVDDANMDGLVGGALAGGVFVDLDEVADWAFSVSGFADPALDFMIASSDAGATDTNSTFVGPGLGQDIGGGLTAQNFDFRLLPSVGLVQINLAGAGSLDVSAAGNIGAFNLDAIYRTSVFSITLRKDPPMSPVPLPGALALLLSGLGGMLALGRRKSA